MIVSAAGRYDDRRAMHSRMQRHLTEVRQFRIRCLAQRGLSPTAIARELGGDPARVAVPASQ